MESTVKIIILFLALFSTMLYAASSSGWGMSRAEAVRNAHIHVVCYVGNIVILDKSVSQDEKGWWTATILYECRK